MSKKLPDPVNHPAHYTYGPMEVIDIIEQYGFAESYHLGNVLKYLFRAGRKSRSKVEDLRKAAWYLQRAIEWETKRRKA